MGLVDPSRAALVSDRQDGQGAADALLDAHPTHKERNDVTHNTDGWERTLL